MGTLTWIVVTASLVATSEVDLHAFSIGGKLVDPALLRWQEVELVVQELLGHVGQPGQSVERVSRWDLLILGGGNGKNDG